MWKGISLEKKNTLVLGEAGSGKTEFAIATALHLRKMEEERVSVFDMDQTKPLYRLRNVAKSLEKQGIQVYHSNGLMDSPVVPAGVEAALQDPRQRVLLDAGGNKAGAFCLGQYRELLGPDTTQVFYLINPYRGFSGSRGDIARTMEEILSCGGWQQVTLVCNPYCGGDGDAETALAGAQRLTTLLEPLGLRWEIILLPAALWQELSPRWPRAAGIRPHVSRILDL